MPPTRPSAPSRRSLLPDGWQTWNQAEKQRLLETLTRERDARQRKRHASPLALARALDPATRTSPALELIDRALVELMAPASPHDALAIFMSPQEGKSQAVARRFPEWLLALNSALRNVIVSFELDTAVRWGREIKRDIAAAGNLLPIQISADTSAAGRWDTPQGGGVYCTGIGGALSGRPVDGALIIDDPVKDRADAESERKRDMAWDWWESVAVPRLGTGARVVLIQTRWHADDLAGRILSRPGPLRWRVLSMPAICDSPDDPLGREIGEEFPSVRGRAPGYFANLRAGLSPYVFSGIYQQDPVAPEGNFFRRATFRYWRPAPPWPGDGRERISLEGRLVTLVDAWRFAVMDVAASVKTSADYTVCGVFAMSIEGDLILLGVARERVEQHDHFAMAAPLMARWGASQLYVERHFFATTLVADARDAGVPVAEVVADADKVTRAIPAAGRIHAGRFWFPAEDPLLDAVTDELASFPAGAHDDIVDVVSYAARIATAEWTPPRTQPTPGPDPHERALAAAHKAATGNGDRPMDIMGVPW